VHRRFALPEEYFKVVAIANEVIGHLKLAYPDIQLECHFNSELNNKREKEIPGGAGDHVILLIKMAIFTHSRFLRKNFLS